MSKKAQRRRRADPEAKAAAQLPHEECCESRPRCARCPIRMLAEGRMPKGYTVRKRKLVRM